MSYHVRLLVLVTAAVLGLGVASSARAQDYSGSTSTIGGADLGTGNLYFTGTGTGIVIVGGTNSSSGGISLGAVTSGTTATVIGSGWSTTPVSMSFDMSPTLIGISDPGTLTLNGANYMGITLTTYMPVAGTPLYYAAATTNLIPAGLTPQAELSVAAAPEPMALPMALVAAAVFFVRAVARNWRRAV